MIDTFTTKDVEALGVRAEQMLAELAAISADPDRLVRLFLSPEHRRAADLVAQWMRAAGLRVSEDALGTVRGHWSGGDGEGAKPRLLIGSHIDTVIGAGKYDGTFGVVAGILAAEHIMRRKSALAFALDVLAFGDEEGSRFPSMLSSSAAAAGCFEISMLAVTDAEGIRFSDALRSYGKAPSDIVHAAYRAADVVAYVEVHIEQGPVLEAERQPLGVVTGIVGQTRLRVVVTGEAGHAGTVPMRLRHDALAAAMEMALALEAIARDNEADSLVATVGRCETFPNAANVIPQRVVFTVDLRSLTDAVRQGALDQFATLASKIAERRGVEVALDRYHEIATTPCSTGLQEQLAAAMEDLGARPVRLVSGAGHDGQMMARLCPVGMLFVRCRGGISHNPAEFASEADMGLAIAALIRFIDRFDPHRARS